MEKRQTLVNRVANATLAGLATILIGGTLAATIYYSTRENPSGNQKVRPYNPPRESVSDTKKAVSDNTGKEEKLRKLEEIKIQPLQPVVKKAKNLYNSAPDGRWILERNTYTSESIIGDLYDDQNLNGKIDDGDVFLCHTLELSYKNNQKNISSVPEGEYTLRGRRSAKFKKHQILENVPGRSYILIHAGNYPRNTQGCILPGMGKGRNTVTSSRVALKGLNRRAKAKKHLRLKIVGKGRDRATR